MALNELLDEILDDKVSDEIEKVEGVEDPALEEIRSIKTKSTGRRFNISTFDNRVVDKFNTLYSKVRLKETVAGMVKIDRAIAQEAMATLPEVNPAMAAKLTSYPSAINRKLLDDIIFAGNDEVPEELEKIIREMLEEVNSSFDANEKLLTEIKISSNLLRDLLKTKYVEGPTKSIVIYDGKSLDLVHAPLQDLFMIEDTRLDYDKYANVLSEKIRGLTYSPKIIAFGEYLSEHCGGAVLGEHSVLDLVNEIMRTEVIATANFDNIKNFKESATAYFQREEKTLTGWVSDLVNSLDSVLKSSDSFNKIADILDGKDGVVQQLYDYLTFLD